MDILLHTATIADIPVLTLAPQLERPSPAIFLLPGFGGTRESCLSLGYRLAQRGFFCISFDPWLHGARYDARLDHAAAPEYGGIYPPETGLDTGVVFYHVIQQCRSDVATLLAHYAADPRVDGTRCGVTGFSMGGYAAYLIFADLPQIQAAVAMGGIPSFMRRWVDVLDECAFSNPAWDAALRQIAAQTRAHTDFIRQLDPLERLLQAAPRALLMMNGDFDCDQPKSYAIATYRDLRAAYAACPERLKLNIYPAAHTVTAEMERDAVDWFTCHLAAH